MSIEQIWSDYKASLKRFIQSKVANEADVEDLLQDILIKTHNNLEQLKSHKSIKSWLFQIANYTIIDFYRRKSRNTSLNAEDTWLKEVDENEAREYVANCIVPFINALPEEQAALLTAIDINNQSQKEYAHNVGISYSTLKSRVQKSRRELKNIFDQCCHFKFDKQGNLYDFEEKRR
ncbi:RNA polymerase sigma factor SigZ [Flocculibacter collagenilyticus]|uniref:RNA polymerase sigma factor SigZ n=1 Tax=Flocculibacter collagenilyticus TaxID=2744479 RepID=UPI0018F5A22C|nr:RNA polymerase sigma factor SigZ [Flocculibacter collagenilyticus]